MKSRSIIAMFSLGAALTAQTTRNHDVALTNWAAPLYWQPSQAEATTGKTVAEVRPSTPDATTPVGSLVFVAMTPCRVVDTRSSCAVNSPLCIAATFGPPSLSGSPSSSVTRSFPIQSSPTCSIPSNAMAYSFNVTLLPITPGTSVGYLTLWPTGGPPPNAVTVDDITGDYRNNAAIVPAGTPNGSVSAITNGNTDLVIDINGYYVPSTGVTLGQGTAGAPSLSFSNDPGTGLFSSAAGTLNLAADGSTAMTVGGSNTALGLSDLSVTTGSFNTALGSLALKSNTAGSSNAASGFGALSSNTMGSNNTASGASALFANTVGANNTAMGAAALNNNTTGSNNIAVGYQAGSNNIGGAGNIDIGNTGDPNDGLFTPSVIRIGTGGVQQSFFVAGVRGITTGQQNAIPVMIDSNGQLGTVSSSRRFKEDIQDMNDASSALLRLRPVTYRYQQPYADGSKPIDYGLIAEEVANVYPDLVARSADGQIETVQYQKLTPMLLNELQKEHETTQSLQAQVSALREVVETLLAGKAQRVAAAVQ